MVKEKSVIHLRVHKGAKVSYNQDGSIQNENQIVKLTHNTKEWKMFMKHLRANMFIKVEVLGSVSKEGVERTEKEDETFTYKFKYEKAEQKIINEVAKAFGGNQEIVLTPEQKQIAELERKIEAMSNGSKQKDVNSEPVKEAPKNEGDLATARAKYEEVLGKKPHHKMGLEKINEEIKAAQVV